MDGISAGRVDRAIGESAQSILRVNRAEELTAPAGADKALVAARDITKVQGAEKSRNESSPGGGENPSKTDLKSLSDNLNKAFEKTTGIRFQLSEDGGEVVVQVVDLQSDEVIRSIPSDRVAELKRNFQEFGREAGVLLDQRA